jgi:hypothetical protein
MRQLGATFAASAPAEPTVTLETGSHARPMTSEPAVHIAIRVGDPQPSVFSTALNSAENRRLTAWLSEHPGLDELYRRAWQLANSEDDEDGAL